MAFSYVFSLPFIFILSLLISLILYATGSIISPKIRKRNKRRSGKLEPYACGEPMPGRKLQVDIQRFFLYVTAFMIFDISAFILALSFAVGAFYPILFCTIIAWGLLTVIPVIGRNPK
ncbi:hypothetical protein B6U79_04570 [Candidatus Bathyarchaeota archaeon ex4484_231]|nr:MAG: hypothetical protein B6U79_04570 [Candidatus Bathyarchaeota archaeon ex4484_231]RJS76038.1 MAG: hypothetical protein CW712_02825 [Candidatus Bathyarchaeota archaeon]